MPFHLVKWYADVVAPDGRYAIGYWAELRQASLRIRYASLIEGAPSSPAAARTTLRPGPEPGIDHWHEPKLAAAWRFLPSAPPFEQTLLTTNQGHVRWHCLAPAAQVVMNRIAGRGYLERIELTIPPWRLPIQTLLWGRLLTPGHSLVWIEWHGAHPLRLTLSDGQPVPQPFPELCSFDNATTIRQGPIGPGILRAIPGLPAPVQLLQIHEHKLLSRARLHHPPGEGWAIHETVNWP
ncbi:MAG: hypothetical protein HY821_00350 [Acidobacteria bacterium]|nr:hypothetical protein [Acidobacteriota bacterium]